MNTQLEKDVAAIQERLKDLPEMKTQLIDIHTATIKMAGLAEKMALSDKKDEETEKRLHKLESRVSFASGGVKALLVGVPLLGAFITWLKN